MLKSAARYVKHTRLSRNISSSEFAEICSISRTYFSQIENCRRIPTIELMDFIFSKLDISFEFYVSNYNKIDNYLCGLYKGLIFVNKKIIVENIQWIFQHEALVFNSKFRGSAFLLMTFYYLESEDLDRSKDVLKSFHEGKCDLKLKQLQLGCLQEGVFSFKNNAINDSISKLESALNLGSDPMLTAMALYYLSQAYEKKGLVHAAIESIQKCIQLFSEELNHYRLTSAQILYANLLRKIGNYSASSRLFESLLYSNDFKYDIEQKEFLLEKYIKLKVCLCEYKDAVTLITLLEKTSISNSSVEFMKAICLYKLNDRNNANMVVERFISRHKQKTPTYCSLMKYLKLKFNKANAITLINVLESINYDECSVDVEIAIYMELVDLYEKIFKYKKSNYYLKKLLEHGGFKGDKIYEESCCN